VTAITRLASTRHSTIQPRREYRARSAGRARRAPLPTLSEVLTAESTLWQMVSVPSWYGAGERTIEIASATAVWRHAGLPVLPIRWVLIRDPEGRLAPQALLWLTSTEVVEIPV
jgi:hypothetical protein